MTETQKPNEDTMVHHICELAASADDVVAMLRRPHDQAEIHPEALGRAEQLSAGLRDIIEALTHHDHLVMTVDDVWKTLTIEHRESGDGFVT
ncbi:MAG: hypothetical protein ACI8TP_000928 [Acidimicrobiales bacterium]|jgi:hypothetical protein